MTEHPWSFAWGGWREGGDGGGEGRGYVAEGVVGAVAGGHGPAGGDDVVDVGRCRGVEDGRLGVVAVRARCANAVEPYGHQVGPCSRRDHARSSETERRMAGFARRAHELGGRPLA